METSFLGGVTVVNVQVAHSLYDPLQVYRFPVNSRGPLHIGHLSKVP